MDVFSYIALKNSEGARQLLAQYSRLKPRNEQELAGALKAVYRGLDIDEKEDFLMELGEIHPDKELFPGKNPLESDYTDGQPMPSDTYKGHCNCHACRRKPEQMTSWLIGNSAHASGTQAVAHYMAANGEADKLSGVDTRLHGEIQSLKTQTEVNKIFNDKIFKGLVVAILLVVLYKLFLKTETK